MKKSKLIRLLTSFSVNEWRRFEEFVNSSYFNKNEYVVRLHKYLEVNRPDFEITKEEAFRNVFPELDYDESKLGYVMSDLLHLSEKFLAVERFLKNSAEQKRFALAEFANRKLHKHYQFLHKKASKELVVQKMGNRTLLDQLLLREVELMYFSKQKVRKYDPSIQQAYNALNEYYYLQLLKHVCSLLNWSGVVSGSFVITSISKKIINELAREKKAISPLLKIYLLTYQTLSKSEEGDKTYFEELVLQLEKHQSRIASEELRELYLLAINYCAIRTRKGNNEYLPMLLKMYDEGIKNEALVENGYLSHWTYTNVVRLGLKEGRYKWVENFIDQYKDLLPPDTFTDAYHLNLADLHFNQQNYDGVLDHLTQLQFSDPSYHLASRLLLIKTFYEREDVEALLSNLASFTIYLKRNKGTSAAYKRTCLNFCTLLHQLLKKNPKKRDQLLEQIKTVQPLAERAWLLKVWEEHKL